MSELSDEGKMFHFYVYGHKINVCHFMHATLDVCDATASVSASFSSYNFVCDNLTCISKIFLLSFSFQYKHRHIYPDTFVYSSIMIYIQFYHATTDIFLTLPRQNFNYNGSGKYFFPNTYHFRDLIYLLTS